ncbi:hypothetical protein [Gallaecimonas sp. GXIMD4217]|uniref:hypothetical protein n=1 Tax=Gallaecimonas sp. GXIMD4217 TaxID=3131927 RepID=UPI00311AC061
MGKQFHEQHATINAFLDAEIPTLLALAEGVLHYRIDDQGLQAALWDLLEHWQSLGTKEGEPQHERERVFWLLVGLMSRHKPYRLRGHWATKSILLQGMGYLRGDSAQAPTGPAPRP